MGLRAAHFVVAAILGASAIGSAPPADRVALIVGNSQYAHTTTLKNPVNDAGAIADALTRLDFAVTRGLDLGKSELDRAVSEFEMQLQTAAVAVFYYAGHGMQVDGKNYLLPVDFDPNAGDDLSLQLISLDTVLARLSEGERTSIVFLDACRDNPLAQVLANPNGRSRALVMGEDRGIKVVGQGLAEVQGGVGMLIAFATQPGNVASDGTGRHSPFTEGLLRYIEKPGQEIGKMLRNVANHVHKNTGKQQVPWVHSSMTEGFYFKTKKVRRLPPP